MSGETLFTGGHYSRGDIIHSDNACLLELLNLFVGKARRYIVATAAGIYQDQEWTGVSAGFMYLTLL